LARSTSRTQEDTREVALIENLQREDLNPIEEAEALLALKLERRYTDAELAKIVGKSRQAINDSLLLTKLPTAIKAECRTSGAWSKSQLLQVLRAGSREKVEALWQGIKNGAGVTVRALREKTSPRSKQGRPAHYRFEHKPDGKPFSVTVSFTKKTATRAEVRGALNHALRHLP
jgi:ParB family chromosome partitioning protein